VDTIIYTGRISRYLEEEHNRKFMNGTLKFLMVGEFLVYLKQEFGNGNNESVKVAKLKKVE